MPPPPPPKDPPPPITSLATLLTTLTRERNTLHLLIYKSKNQHRASLWFKWARMLKRSLERIILLLQSLPQSTSDPQDSDLSDDEADISTALTLQSHLIKTLSSNPLFPPLLLRLETAVIPNAHRAFTLLITSTQYAGIGLVLLGCLARIHGVLTPFFPSPELENEEEEAVPNPASKTPNPTRDIIHSNNSEDEDEEEEGEVISRDSLARTTQEQRQKVELRTKRKSTTPLPDSDWEFDAAVKSKKQRTAIDDLFADL